MSFDEFRQWYSTSGESQFAEMTTLTNNKDESTDEENTDNSDVCIFCEIINFEVICSIIFL